MWFFALGISDLGHLSMNLKLLVLVLSAGKQ